MGSEVYPRASNCKRVDIDDTRAKTMAEVRFGRPGRPRERLAGSRGSASVRDAGRPPSALNSATASWPGQTGTKGGLH